MLSGDVVVQIFQLVNFDRGRDKDSNSAKKCLLTFDFTAKHLKLKSTGHGQRNGEKYDPGQTDHWPCRRRRQQEVPKAIVELVQLNLINLESKIEMDTDVHCAESSSDKPAEQFIKLIPYLFLALQTIETVSPVVSSEYGSIDLIINEYLQIVCLNSLMLIYKLNSSVAESKLVRATFDIELFMRML